MTFRPESILLNSVYIPFYAESRKQIRDLTYLTLETDVNGIESIINFKTVNSKNVEVPVFPFIDTEKYDQQTKTWFYYDTDGFPYRLTYDDTLEDWTLVDVWDINNYSASGVFDPEDLDHDPEANTQLGLFTTISDNVFHRGDPIVVTIEGEPLIDKTNYGTKTVVSTLTTNSTESNKEFYYNTLDNKIYTNQDLSFFDPTDIKVFYYQNIDTVNVKCRMSGNSNRNIYSTPIVDYYIVKLNGQLIRG